MKKLFENYPTEIAQVCGTILVIIATIIGFLSQ